MFRNMYKALGLAGVAMLFVISYFAVPALAESDPSGNTAVVTDSHCSGGEGFALVMLTASSQASEPVEFKVYADGVLKDTEQLAPGGDPFGVSIGSLAPGEHSIQVTADGQEITVQPNSTVTIVCDDTSGIPIPVIVDQIQHHHKKHHHKHHKHHKKPSFALPHVGA